MKFLIVAPRFHTNLYYRAIALQNVGHIVKVLTLYKGKSEFYENIDVEVLNLSFFSKLIVLISNLFKKTNLKSSVELRIHLPNKELKKEIKSFKPDVIILKAYQNLLAIKTLLLARKFKIKVLMLTQTTFTHIKGSKLLFRLNIKFFKKLGVYAYVTPIKSNYDAFKSVGIENVFYVPFVFPAATTLSESKSENSGLNTNNIVIKLISVGKFVKRKDQLLLIKACHQLIKKKYAVELNIFGENAAKDYYNEVISYVENNNLNKNIAILTDVPYNELLKEYQKHDIFVLPSYAEPAAYSLVEALTNGLPAIVSNECGTKCYINEGVNGFVFEAKNRNDLVVKLEALVSNKNLLKTVSKNAYLMAKEKHNLKSFSETITNIIDN